MNEPNDQILHGYDWGKGREGWQGNRDKKRDSKTGRFCSMGQASNKKEYARRYYLKNKERHKADNAARYLANPEPARRRSRLRSITHKTQMVEYRKQYRANNRHELRVRDRNYQLRNQERIRAVSKRYVENHREQRKATQHRYNTSPKGRAQYKKWYATKGQEPEHKAKRTACDARRRALETGSALPDANTAFAKLASSTKCYYCGRKIPESEKHIDHVKPLAAGGMHAAYNLVPACENCNLRKGRKNPNEFVEGQQLLVF